MKLFYTVSLISFLLIIQSSQLSAQRERPDKNINRTDNPSRIQDDNRAIGKEKRDRLDPPHKRRPHRGIKIERPQQRDPNPPFIDREPQEIPVIHTIVREPIIIDVFEDICCDEPYYFDGDPV